MKRITYEDLSDRFACADQGKLFRRYFPDGAALNRKNTRLAEKRGFNLNWLANEFLSTKNYKSYEQAMDTAPFDVPIDFWYQHVIKPLKKQKSFWLKKY